MITDIAHRIEHLLLVEPQQPQHRNTPDPDSPAKRRAAQALAASWRHLDADDIAEILALANE